MITYRYIRTLEQASTAKAQQQLIIDKCTELENDLDLAIQASNRRLQLFNNHNQKEE